MVHLKIISKYPIHCDTCNRFTRLVCTATRVARVHNKNYQYDVDVVNKCWKCILKKKEV